MHGHWAGTNRKITMFLLLCIQDLYVKGGGGGGGWGHSHRPCSHNCDRSRSAVNGQNRSKGYNLQSKCTQKHQDCREMENLGGVTCEVKGRKSAQSTVEPLKRAGQGFNPWSQLLHMWLYSIPSSFHTVSQSAKRAGEWSMGINVNSMP